MSFATKEQQRCVALLVLLTHMVDRDVGAQGSLVGGRPFNRPCSLRVIVKTGKLRTWLALVQGGLAPANECSAG